MDFETSVESNELSALTRDIVTGREAGWEAGRANTCFDEKLWRELGKAGVLAAALPESAGGAGLGLLEQCGVLTELGRALAPAPYLASIVLGASAIATFGTTEQQERWAVPAARGDILLTAALPDPSAATSGGAISGGAISGGANAQLTRSSEVNHAIESGIGLVPAAPWADAVLVPADGAVYIVETNDPGVTVEPQELTDGVTAGRLVLDARVWEALRLDAGRRLGGGDVVAEWLMARGTVGLCALQLGITERALELTAEYATQRVQFSRPIGAFQAVSQRLADAWIDVEAIRLTMWQAAWQLTENMPAELAVSTAKFWAADAGHRIAHTAVHVHGGVGIDTSHPLHRYFAAAKTNEFSLGHATTQLRRIGAELAKS
jgi:alkylation response protein AidB-like acyl-CoA dehydrogenase